MTERQTDNLRAIAVFLRDTANACRQPESASKWLKLTPEEVAVRLDDTAGVLIALARGEL